MYVAFNPSFSSPQFRPFLLIAGSSSTLHQTIRRAAPRNVQHIPRLLQLSQRTSTDNTAGVPIIGMGGMVKGKDIRTDRVVEILLKFA